jgi:hypothetical protein
MSFAACFLPAALPLGKHTTKAGCFARPWLWTGRKADLQVPKREIFKLNYPIWVGELGTEAKKWIFKIILFRFR